MSKRAEELQRKYLEQIQGAKKPEVVQEKKDYGQVIYWIYVRRWILIHPIQYKYELPMAVIEQIKYGNNTYHFGK